jgi:tRNA pseudouridine55 synthase
MEVSQSDLLLIDKPKGITSFDVIRHLRKSLNVRKMGHSGTLDPLATGLLIIGVGKGTKKLHNLIGLPKTYEAEILLGVKTDTGDVDGVITTKATIPILHRAKIEEALLRMKGRRDLPAPIFSALKKEGKPLYAYARKGEHVEAPLKSMEVTEVNFLDFNNNVLRVFFAVSSGTYIRTLAEVLASDLGTLGTIQNLRRISIGDYSVSDAEPLEKYGNLEI